MKKRIESLDEFINEMEQTKLNEAFQSEILRTIHKNNKSMWKEFARSERFAFDKMTDDDFETYGKEDIKPVKKKCKDGAIVFWLDEDDTLLGISQYSWVKVSPMVRSGGRRSQRQPAFKTVTAITKNYSLSKMYVISDSDKFSTDKLKSDRWASKESALAFKSNWDIASENRKRYEKILAEIKMKRAEGNIDIKESIATVMDMYKKMFDDLVGEPDWIKIQNLGNKISLLIKMFKEVVYFEREGGHDSDGKKYRHQYDEMRKIITKVKTLLKEVEEYNQAQLEA